MRNRNFLILLVFAGVCVVGCNKEQKPKFDEKKPFAILESGDIKPGRFQVLQLGSMRRDVYLIDTGTGQLWVRVCIVPDPKDSTSCHYVAWRPEDIENINITSEGIGAVAKLYSGK